MSSTDEKLDTIIGLLEGYKGYIEWTHNYAIAQVRLLKLSMLEPKHVIAFAHQGTTPIRFYIPKGDIDAIQAHFLLSESFWDQDTLEILAPLVAGRHLLDIGANVGNHSVFWGRVAGAASIQAFEPIPETFGILERNIELNGLGSIVTAHGCALGAENGSGDPASVGSNRMQATVQARADATGAIPVRTLDAFGLDRVDFAKIDVEGHTLAMLRGSAETLRRHRPTLYMELFPHERGQCGELLAGFGYRPVGSIEAGNYVFVHEDRTDEAAAFGGVIRGGWPA